MRRRQPNLNVQVQALHAAVQGSEMAGQETGAIKRWLQEVQMCQQLWKVRKTAKRLVYGGSAVRRVMWTVSWAGWGNEGVQGVV
jgi:hypothetical protein